MQHWHKMSLVSWIRRNFQHCCACGAPVLANRHLCRSCRLHVESEMNYWAEIHSTPEWRGFLLVCLASYRSYPISDWIKALKGGDQTEDFAWLARNLIRRRILLPDPIPLGPVVVVPTPPRVLGKNDHAYCLAKEISRQTGWPLQEGALTHRRDGQPQKQKSEEERRAKEFAVLDPGALIDLSTTTIIFVDDVVTTGGTVEAAWRALERPRHFEVWCVAHQPRLLIPK